MRLDSGATKREEEGVAGSVLQGDEGPKREGTIGRTEQRPKTTSTQRERGKEDEVGRADPAGEAAEGAWGARGGGVPPEPTAEAGAGDVTANGRPARDFSISPRPIGKRLCL